MASSFKQLFTSNVSLFRYDLKIHLSIYLCTYLICFIHLSIIYSSIYLFFKQGIMNVSTPQKHARIFPVYITRCAVTSRITVGVLKRECPCFTYSFGSEIHDYDVLHARRSRMIVRWETHIRTRAESKELVPWYCTFPYVCNTNRCIDFCYNNTRFVEYLRM